MPTKICETCGKEFEAQRRTAKFCNAQCRYHNHLVDKKRIHIPRDLRFSILRRDGFMCRYCGAKPVEKELRVDHIVSIEDGGARTASDNLITACNDCNSGKGKLSVDPKEIPPLA